MRGLWPDRILGLCSIRLWRRASTSQGRAARLLLVKLQEDVMRHVADRFKHVKEQLGNEQGAMGYILLWAMGVPASVLFLIFLLRGCN
jgi:hypothetical protein